MDTVIKKRNIFKRAARKFGKKSTSEKITYIVFFFFFVAMAVLFVYPIANALINTFRVEPDFGNPNRSPFAKPLEWYTLSWSKIFTEFYVIAQNGSQIYYFGMLFNSLWMLVLRVILATMSSALLAYAVARFRFPGRGLLYALVIFKQTIPIFGAGGSGYKLMNSLNMINNPTMYWIAWLSGFDFEFIVLYGAFKGISSTYSEAAKIDGANNLTILFRIIFPQALPCVLALAITQSMAAWNDFNTSLLYLPDYPTIAFGLYSFKTRYAENGSSLHSSAVLISMIPLVVLYACSQKLILTNTAVGGLKG